MIGLRVLAIGAGERPCRCLEREATVKSAKDMKIVAKMTRLPRVQIRIDLIKQF